MGRKGEAQGDNERGEERLRGTERKGQRDLYGYLGEALRVGGP